MKCLHLLLDPSWIFLYAAGHLEALCVWDGAWPAASTLIRKDLMRGMDEQYSSISLCFLGHQAKTQNWASVLRSAQTCTLEGIWKHYYFLGLFFLAVFVWFLCCHILASTEVLRFHELKISCKPVKPSFQPVSAEKLEKSCLSIRIFSAYVRSFWIL